MPACIQRFSHLRSALGLILWISSSRSETLQYLFLKYAVAMLCFEAETSSRNSGVSSPYLWYSIFSILYIQNGN